MAFNLKNRNVSIGVAITPEVGLEVAQIDFETHTIVRYGRKALAYNNARKEVADLDIFKEQLLDLFSELDIQKGADVYLSLPAATFGVIDCPAAWNEEEIYNSLQDTLQSYPLYEDSEFVLSSCILPNSTIQMNKVVQTSLPKFSLIEIVMQIQELGYNIANIDVSVNTTLNALLYNEQVDLDPTKTWLMLQIDNNYCRIITMQGRNYVDAIEEAVNLGEMFSEEENYATVTGVLAPILRNIPAHYLCIVSKTNTIRAEVLASKIKYNAPIIHLEDNVFTQSCPLSIMEGLNITEPNLITNDIIGISIAKDFAMYSSCHFNLFNSQLGNLYLENQPLEITLFGHKILLSIANASKFATLLAIICGGIIALAISLLFGVTSQQKGTIQSLTEENAKLQTFIDNNDISANAFDEGDEVRIGLGHNKAIYSCLTVIGTEIPKKLWLTHLKLDDAITIEGQADNLESIYGFFRNLKDYDTETGIKLQKLSLASKSNLANLDEKFDTDSVLNSLTADFYEFRISNAPEDVKKDSAEDEVTDADNEDTSSSKNKKKNDKKLKKGKAKADLPELEPAE